MFILKLPLTHLSVQSVSPFCSRLRLLIKWRNPCITAFEMLLPIGFFIVMSLIPADSNYVASVVPELNFTVPDLNLIWEQTQDHKLCYDNNLFARCGCDYPDQFPGVSTVVQYAYNGLVYPIESLFQTVHGSNSYFALCQTLALEAINCTLLNDALDFCPRFESYFSEAADTLGCTLNSNNGSISSPTEGMDMINEAIGNSHGIAIPDDEISSNCADLFFGIAPLREQTVQNGGATFESFQEELAYLFYMNLTSDLSGIDSNIKLFDNNDQIDTYVEQSGYGRSASITTLGGAIVFNSDSDESINNFDYTLRFNHTREQAGTNPDFRGAGYYEMNTPMTTKQVDISIRNQEDVSQGPKGRTMFPGAELYYLSGLLSMQQYVDAFILNFTATAAELTNGVANMPTAGYTQDGFWASIGSIFGILFTLVLLFPVSNIIKQIVQDKELRLKEGMMQMGLDSSVYWVTWITHFSVEFLIVTILLTIIGAWWDMFQYSYPFYVFWFLFLFCTATIAMCIFISSFFSKARTAATLGVMVFFVSVFPYFAVNGDTSNSSILAICILPASCLAIGTIPLSTYEDSGIGITSDTLWSIEQDNVSFGQCIIMLLIDTFLYGLLAWYASEVIPSEWGTCRPWYFFVTPSFWSCGRFGNKVHGAKELNILQNEAEVEGSGGKPGEAWIEKVSPNLLRQVTSETCLAVRNLKKEFHSHGTTVYAIGADNMSSGLSITMFRGQVTALLGHNGAGKSTIMNMLSGMTSVSNGDAYLSGKSVRMNMKEIRHDLGVCPQHDILYDNVTVLEHLQLFAVIKGVPGKDVQEEAESMIRAVGLTEKRNEHANTLSGGQKRKLSVGMAFIGGSTTVFLDEPTSGMDPHSRRFTWDVIRQLKQGRIILLTTHFMDEADLLGDRIAILSHGQLQCCGSSLFLKRVYGVGYSLTLVKDEGHEPLNSCEEIIDLMKTHVPETKLLSDVGNEISLQLPQAAGPHFPALLAEIDEKLELLHIASYGLSVTTLEEVFLKVAKGTALHEDERAALKAHRSSSILISNSSNSLGDDEPEKAMPRSSGDDVDGMKTAADVFHMQMRSLTIKRWLSFKRERKMQFFIWFAPIILILIGLLILKFTNQGIQPSISLDANDSYSSNPFYYNDECSNALATCTVGDAVDGLVSQSLGPATPLDGSTLLGLNNELFNSMQQGAQATYGSFAWDIVDFGTSTFQPVATTNISGVHAAPIFMNALTTSWLMGLSGNSDSKVTTRVHPLPPTKHETDLANGFMAIFAFIFVTLAFSFIPTAWVGFVVRERENGSKNLQVVTGVSPHAYWLSTYLWDIISFLFPPCCFTLIFMGLFQLDALVQDGAIAAFLVLLVLWVVADTGFTYVISFFFKSHTIAMTVTLLAHLVLGVILPFVIYAFLVFRTTKDVGKALKWALRIFPPYAMGDGVLNLASRQVLSYAAGEGSYGVWSLDVTTADIIYLLAFTFIYGGLIYVLEMKLQGTNTVFSYFSERKLNHKLRNIETPSALWDSDLKGDKDHPPMVEDVDVVAERKKIQDGVKGGVSNPNDVIEIDGLRKAYPISDSGLKVAVRGLWLRVSKGDCFGFLGTNGAGKTTTISMIVGEVQPTYGLTKLNGTDVVEHPQIVHRLVGFTPQFDAIFDTLTAREHLFFYGRIKGISPNVLASAVEKVLNQVGLTEYADRLAGGYSGGNKRKLSVGIALLGSPPIILLDEPSTGVDPVARHFIWNVISNIVTERKEAALILTTHLMEECEALSNRIGIMVDGRLRCLGSAQHLKERFGKGFQLEVRMGMPSEEQEQRKSMAISSYSDNSSKTNSSPNPEAKVCSGVELLAIIESKAPALLPFCNEPGGPASMIESFGSIPIVDLAAWVLQEEEYNKILTSLQRAFPGIELRERQGLRLRFDIPHMPGLSLAKLFSVLEEMKGELGTDEYMLGQTTLENIFNAFASNQQEETAPAPGMARVSVS